MSNIIHKLTPVEDQCGVTLTQVADLLPQILFIDQGSKLVFPARTSPALASSTARYAFRGPAEFVGLNQLEQPVYRRAAASPNHNAPRS